MTSNNIIVSIKLRLNVGNDEWISILCNFDGRIMCEVPTAPVERSEKRPV